MAVSKENADRTSSDSHHNIPDEESLPLYSNLDFDEAVGTSSLDLPDSTATPDKVREYLVQLLTIQRKLPIDHARRAAARWSTGSGRELRKYSPAMYLTIFGPEDGWLLYKDVMVALHKTKKKENDVPKYCTEEAAEAALKSAFVNGAHAQPSTNS
ncbi:hypothetical protein LTR85_003325 [Meristemomyces frigidus]|nr:hypothetical protein LTR85_003325 [Meristemomyces frigidus]